MGRARRGLAATLVLLRLDGGTGASIAFAPLRQGDMLLRWLSGPFVYAAWPLLDPQIASQLPVAAARVPAQAVAQAYEGAFVPLLLAGWPQLSSEERRVGQECVSTGGIRWAR